MNFSVRSLRCPPYCLHVATGDKRRMDTEERIMNIPTEVVCGSGHSRRVPRGCNCLGVCFFVALFCLNPWRYCFFSRGVFSCDVISSPRMALYRLFAWRHFVFSRGVILSLRVSFRMMLFRLFVFSSFRVASFRLFVYSHGVISRRKDEKAKTSHHR